MSSELCLSSCLLINTRVLHTFSNISKFVSIFILHRDGLSLLSAVSIPILCPLLCFEVGIRSAISSLCLLLSDNSLIPFVFFVLFLLFGTLCASWLRVVDVLLLIVRYFHAPLPPPLLTRVSHFPVQVLIATHHFRRRLGLAMTGRRSVVPCIRGLDVVKHGQFSFPFCHSRDSQTGSLRRTTGNYRRIQRHPTGIAV